MPLRLQTNALLRLASLSLVIWASGPALAQPPVDAPEGAVPSLADLSLEQLSSIEVTSVGKRVQRLADVAGSVFVISQEDIRRSGASTLPEVLRLAPNLQVARADAAQYAITARGFNSVLANKILVLVDGRTVYSPLFSGVFWEAQDTLLDDVERIEVLSGAGGTLYGSNAVNGVINIITRNAGETGGWLAKGQVGSQEDMLAARYGGGSGTDLPWRLYAKRHQGRSTRLENGSYLGDWLQRNQAGFRADGTRERDQLTVQGDVYEAHINQLPSERRVAGANLLARWSRDHSGGTRTQLQAYFDRTERDQPGLVNDRLNTWDIELQQSLRPVGPHELLWGAGFRRQQDTVTNLVPAQVQIQPRERRLNLWNAFVQDEFALAPGWRLTAGIKAEHNSYTGMEWLPTARLGWQALPGHLLWASASRAVRVPSRVDRDVTLLPVLPRGGAGFESEVARVYELGFRGQPHGGLSYSVTAFHHDFERLRSIDLGPGGAGFGNGHTGRLDGLEAWTSWRFADRWRLQAGLLQQRLRIGRHAGSTAVPGGEAQLGNDPRRQGQVGLGWDVAPRMELDLRVRHVGALPDPRVAGYTAVDLRWGWRVRPDLELSIAARNLNDPWHAEWGQSGTRAEVPRSLSLKAVWRH